MNTTDIRNGVGAGDGWTIRLQKKKTVEFSTSDLKILANPWSPSNSLEMMSGNLQHIWYKKSRIKITLANINAKRQGLAAHTGQQNKFGLHHQ
ncbi:hypothetical protein EVAR_99584_1 [Eumeta japonica]|uniref:Uncharacterized protein n=1 Tax=Eumeta variegata TaxID=151549 RepID=A0A4C1ZL13_EUMVA|nr:hypothetical protein EVAR_99584_1 [Eumeta japonica]